jgi:hypothetical protein
MTVISKDRPSEKVLKFAVDYFKDLADKQCKLVKREYGIVEFMYRDIQTEVKEDSDIPIKLNKTQIVEIMKWLRTNGYAKQLRIGRHKTPSLWDVRNLLEKPPLKGEPDLDDDEEPKFEVQFVKDPVESTDEITEYKVDKKDNNIVLTQINESINDMVSYLQTLPTEMMSELKGLSKNLELADHDVIMQLTKDKEDLKEEVSILKEELEKAQSTPDYSEHYIYRQRNLILDEVQRILHGPAWSIRQNKEHYNNSITEKIDNIMGHLDIKA